MTYDPGPEKTLSGLATLRSIGWRRPCIARDWPGVPGSTSYGADGPGAVFQSSGSVRSHLLHDPGLAAPRAGDEEAPPPGAFCWDELLTPDPTRAVAFYRDTIGWGHKTLDMGNAGTYWLFTSGHRERAGMVQSEPGTPAMASLYSGARRGQSRGGNSGAGGEILDSPRHPENRPLRHRRRSHRSDVRRLRPRNRSLIF